jgi:RNA polymerase sigma factor (sigma-70 family)
MTATQTASRADPARLHAPTLVQLLSPAALAKASGALGPLVPLAPLPPSPPAALAARWPSAAEDHEGTALMQRLQAQDAQALARLYQLTVARVFSLALRITRNHATAEEVTEDVYVQLWHSACRFDAQRGSALAWALTICRSRALDALRRADPALLDPDPHERADANVGLGDDPQDLLQASRENASLHAALQRLSPLQRQLLGLAFFRDLSHAELATQMGLPLGTVKSALRRSLAVLRQSLVAR